MAARTLSQIVAELSKVDQPQIQSLQRQQAAIPTQIAEQQKGLEAQQTQAFGDILGGARQRGLGFSGIPLSEQARYTSTQFLPALTNLRQQGNQQQQSLQDAILGIQANRNTFGRQLYQQEQDRAQQQAQYNADLAFRRQQFAYQQRQDALERQQAAAEAARDPYASLFQKYIDMVNSQNNSAKNRPTLDSIFNAPVNNPKLKVSGSNKLQSASSGSMLQGGGFRLQ